MGCPPCNTAGQTQASSQKQRAAAPVPRKPQRGGLSAPSAAAVEPGAQLPSDPGFQGQRIACIPRVHLSWPQGIQPGAAGSGQWAAGLGRLPCPGAQLVPSWLGGTAAPGSTAYLAPRLSIGRGVALLKACVAWQRGSHNTCTHAAMACGSQLGLWWRGQRGPPPTHAACTAAALPPQSTAVGVWRRTAVRLDWSRLG